MVKGFYYRTDVLGWGFRSSVFQTFSMTDVSSVVVRCLGSILKPACCWTCWTQPVVLLAISVFTSFVSFFRGSKLSTSCSLITDDLALLNKMGTSALCGIGLDSSGLLAVEGLGLVLDQTLYRGIVAIDVGCAVRWPQVWCSTGHRHHVWFMIPLLNKISKSESTCVIFGSCGLV